MNIRNISIALLLTCLIAASAHANETKTTGDSTASVTLAENRNTYVFEEVTITARKEDEKIQEVSASIDVFSDIEIEDMGGQHFSDLMDYMPNVFPNANYGTNRIVFRGLKGPDSLLWAPSAFYVDGVNYMIAEMRNPDLFDLESLEVLRGPQGTLYGGNSETGLVNITTRKPTNEYSAVVKGGYSSFNTQNLTGKANIPVIEEKLFVNAAFSSRTSDGYVKNKYDDEYASGTDHFNYRGAMRWLMSNSTTVSLTINHSRRDDEDGSFRIDEGVGATDRFDIDYNGNNSVEAESDVQALRIDYSGDLFNFVSITTNSDFSHTYDGDGDLTSGVSSYGDMVYYLNKDLKSNTQEFRFSSPDSNSALKWIAGFYAMIQEADIKKFTSMTKMYGFPTPYEDFRTTEVDSENMAIFGQLTYTFVERFYLTGGLRMDNIHLESKQTYNSEFMSYPYESYRFEDEIDQSETLPKIALSFDLAENAMVYGSIAKGFLAGGFNTAFGSSDTQFTYDTEYMWSYEMGTKISWLNNSLLVNLSVFSQEIEDKQVKMVVGTDRWIDNAEGARSTGAELIVKARPAQGLDLYTSIGFVDASYTDYKTITEDYTNNTIAFAPENTYNAGAQYRHHSGFFGRLDMNGVSSFYTDPENELECDGYQIFNARLGYESKNWEFILVGKNIFDTEYITDKRAWSTDDSVIAVVDGAPMSMGMDFALRF